MRFNLTQVLKQWRHVVPKQNAADVLSRGCSASELLVNELWWYGPDFLLQDPSHRPKSEIYVCDVLTDEVKLNAEVTLCSQMITAPALRKNSEWKLNLERFSYWLKLLRIHAFVYRFIENCQVPPIERNTGELQVKKIHGAETQILIAMQMKHFPAKYCSLSQGKPISSKSCLLKLRRKLDSEGLMRCDGRLKHATQLPFATGCPIILLNKEWVTTLIVKHFHEKVGHFGVNHTLAAISSRIWILSGREAIKCWQTQCAVCTRNKAKAAEQIMVPLPDNRVSVPIRAFSLVAVDFAGPFTTIQGSGKQRQKHYLCLFTCLACRAVHLEMAFRLDTDSFLNAFFRMAHRRGFPKLVISDNSGNFIAAEKELIELWSNVDNDKISRNLAKHAITWSFIPLWHHILVEFMSR